MDLLPLANDTRCNLSPKASTDEQFTAILAIFDPCFAFPWKPATTRTLSHTHTQPHARTHNVLITYLELRFDSLV